jgi:hypothetical protein
LTQKPRTFVGDIGCLPKPLQHITTEKRWCVWRWEECTRKDGSTYWTKPPYQAAYPKTPAKNNDPNTWGNYDDAVAVVLAGEADGIGFMLKDSEVAAADLDHCRDAVTGELLDWAQALCAEAESLGLYVETTVSGTGLHFIGLIGATGAELHRKFLIDAQSKAGIELYRNCTRYITVSGLQLGACEDLGEIGGYLDELLARFEKPESSTIADFFDFNTAGPQQHAIDYYRNLIENGAPPGGDRSELFQQVVWHLAAKGYSADEIADELAKYPGGIGQKYAKRLRAEVGRSFGKWQGQKRAAAVGSAAPSTSWPTIKIRGGELPRVVSEAEDALIADRRDIYQRGSLIVRPVKTNADWQLIPMTCPHLVEAFCRAARFVRYDKRAPQGTPEDKKWIQIDAPDKVVWPGRDAGSCRISPASPPRPSCGPTARSARRLVMIPSASCCSSRNRPASRRCRNIPTKPMPRPPSPSSIA